MNKPAAITILLISSPVVLFMLGCIQFADMDIGSKILCSLCVIGFWIFMFVRILVELALIHNVNDRFPRKK